MNVILYSTHCPQCNVLEKKLNDKNIKYSFSEDFDKVIELGYTAAPVLQVDDTFYNFSQAVKLLQTF